MLLSVAQYFQQKVYLDKPTLLQSFSQIYDSGHKGDQTVIVWVEQFKRQFTRNIRLEITKKCFAKSNHDTSSFTSTACDNLSGNCYLHC